MKSNCTIVCLLLAAVVGLVDAYVPSSKKNALKPVQPVRDLQKAAAVTFAALTIASSSSVLVPPPPANAAAPFVVFSSSTVVAEKVVREGVYREYEIDVAPQQYDDARSTFKAASETKSKKGKYTALLAILIVGSFIIPMAQYFWYVRDDDSSDKFFGTSKKIPEPEPPKKKKWF